MSIWKMYRIFGWYWALKALFKRGLFAFIRQRIRAFAIKKFARFLKKIVKV